jgi:NDP-sugar pyrophosphorylase family protein
VGIFTEESLIHDRPLTNTVVLMVGGRGKRLRPLTETCPKPMLRIGGKPILETTIETLRDSGFRHFVLSINYLAEQIERYFGDGSRYGIRINYIRESEPLGTAGALRHLAPVPTCPFVVMNGDILTRLNYVHLLLYHQQSQASATMCVREFDQQVPFGVVELDGKSISRIKEKPKARYFVNSGIYVLEPTTLEYVPDGGPFDMPELFNVLREQRKATIAYPIREYWMDIGRPDDFLQAEREFSFHFEPQ